MPELTDEVCHKWLAHWGRHCTKPSVGEGSRSSGQFDVRPLCDEHLRDAKAHGWEVRHHVIARPVRGDDGTSWAWSCVCGRRAEDDERKPTIGKAIIAGLPHIGGGPWPG